MTESVDARARRGRDPFYEELRPRAFSIAYRMLGSVSEAEDVVQEALLRVHSAVEGGEEISSPRAYVATVTTRLAIDELRSARARRESYVGEWLPEPVTERPEDDPARQAELADSLSMAFLVVLESLSPEQRAAFLSTTSSTTTTTGSPRSSGRVRRTRDSSPRGRGGTSMRAGPGSMPRRSSATSWRRGSSPRSRTAISTDSRPCSPRTSSSTATVGELPRRSGIRSSAVPRRPRCSATGAGSRCESAAYRFAPSQ